jgi:hypothetical protein
VRSSTRCWLEVLALLAGTAATAVAGPIGTAFTYQGRLTDSDAPANGSYDLEFELFDASSGGIQIGDGILVGAVVVSDGLFTVSLDFGSAAFTGEERWLEIGVRPGGSAGPFTTLSPRQPVRPVPNALHSASSGHVAWSGVTGKPSGFADDVDDDSLAALPCAPGEAAVRGASSWSCGGTMPPTPGSPDYIQNQSASAQTASLNITGDALLGGGLKLGVVATSCSSSNEGTLRYDAALKEVQYCDGSAWHPLELKRPVLWSGGCSIHGRADGWNRYCADRTELNTATPDYVSVSWDGTFTFNKAGYYRVTFHTTAYGNGSGAIRFIVNGGTQFYTGYGWVGYGTTEWNYKMGDQIWFFAVGDRLTVEALNPGPPGTGYAFYAADSYGYSRLQVTYVGPS